MLKLFTAIVLFLTLFTSCKKTNNSLKKLFYLDSKLGEISGIVRIGDRYFGHNDSGAKPIVYEINIKTGKVLREVFILNAINIDWEDIAVDSNYIYVGDIGGNNHNRESIVIYKVKIEDLLAHESVYSEVITLKKNKSHPKDFEAMFVKDDNLYLLSKDIKDYICKTFLVELKNPPLELGSAIEETKLSVAITGADYNHKTDEAILLGYSKFDRSNILNFKINILRINKFKNKLFNNLNNIKIFNVKNAIQVSQAESITYSNIESEVFISSEMKASIPLARATLFSFNLY
jgi:hypothetical protein